MKIASRATPEGLVGHGLSTTGVETASFFIGTYALVDYRLGRKHIFQTNEVFLLVITFISLLATLTNEIKAVTGRKTICLK